MSIFTIYCEEEHMKKLFLIPVYLLLSSGMLVASGYTEGTPRKVANWFSNTIPGTPKRNRRLEAQDAWFKFTVDATSEEVSNFVNGFRDYVTFDSEADLEKYLVNKIRHGETLLHKLAKEGLTENDALYTCLTEGLQPSLPEDKVKGEPVLGIDLTIENIHGKTAKYFMDEKALKDAISVAVNTWFGFTLKSTPDQIDAFVAALKTNPSLTDEVLKDQVFNAGEDSKRNGTLLHRLARKGLTVDHELYAHLVNLGVDPEYEDWDYWKVSDVMKDFKDNHVEPDNGDGDGGADPGAAGGTTTSDQNTEINEDTNSSMFTLRNAVIVTMTTITSVCYYVFKRYRAVKQADGHYLGGAQAEALGS